MCTFDTLKFQVRGGAWAVGIDRFVWDDASGSSVRVLPPRVSKGISFGEGEVRNDWRKVQHRSSGLRLFGDARGPESLECSLPRVAHGTNAVLLRPEAVPEAVSKLLGCLAAVAPGAQLADPSRVDLADHLPVPPADAIASLRGLKHPDIRSHPVEYHTTGLSWRGREMVVRLYDKGAEQGIPGGPMRLEVQLRGSKVPPIWDGRALDVEMALRFYRKHVVALVPRPLYVPTDTVAKLAALHSEGLIIDGRPVYEFWGQGYHPKRRAKLAADVLAQVAPRWLLDLRLRYSEGGTWPEFLDAPVGIARAAAVA